MVTKRVVLIEEDQTALAVSIRNRRTIFRRRLSDWLTEESYALELIEIMSSYIVPDEVGLYIYFGPAPASLTITAELKSVKFKKNEEALIFYVGSAPSIADSESVMELLTKALTPVDQLELEAMSPEKQAFIEMASAVGSGD